MIVEDDEDIRNIVGEILENECYEVAGCNYTLENLLTMTADLILLYERVNKQVGPMLCKEIKAIERLAEIPVIIFSTSLDIEQIAATCKANGYVRKPFDLGTLITEVQKFLPLNKNYEKI